VVATTFARLLQLVSTSGRLNEPSMRPCLRSPGIRESIMMSSGVSPTSSINSSALTLVVPSMDSGEVADPAGRLMKKPVNMRARAKQCRFKDMNITECL